MMTGTLKHVMTCRGGGGQDVMEHLHSGGALSSRSWGGKKRDHGNEVGV